jgi:hypothetical protein
MNPGPLSGSTGAPVPGYEPPRIELRLTAEALEREILYAGEPSNGSGPP